MNSDKSTKTHVRTQTDLSHFTPFATLLFQLPQAIREVFATNRLPLFEWDFDTVNGLHVVVWYFHNQSTVIRTRCDVWYPHTAYSYGRIVEILEERKTIVDSYHKSTNIVDNSATD